MRRTSEVMKTKSAVRPSETQRIVLNLEPAVLRAGSVKVGMIRSQMVRRDEVWYEFSESDWS